MDYELCLKLKKAGFPQIYTSYGIYFDDNENLFENPAICIEDERSLDGEKMIKIPTLSELIEACGEDKFALWKGETKWQATKQKESGGGWFSDIGVDIDKYFQSANGEGLTPEEAVAHLWLSLQENNP